jgi:Pyridine nucleotide-disulphide oxidoreductase
MNALSVPPVVVVGAGPVGLAAAAHLLARGLTPLVLERGASAGSALLSWGHVRVFSPWEYNVDRAARALLAAAGWNAPDAKALPTGREIVERYLEPLAAHPKIAPHVVLGATVTGISRLGLDKVASADRHETPFVVRWRDGARREHAALARAVIDASGTWSQPNPMGIDGMPVPGERAAGARIAYGIPDVLGTDRAAYAGRRVLVVGAGHSAINVALDLIRLEQEVPGTHVVWAMRRNRIDRLLGGGLNDELPARGALGLAARRAVDSGRLEMLAPFAAERIELAREHVSVAARIDGRDAALEVDRIVVATGFRPDLSMLRELRVELDPAIEAPPALAPLIDPNVHSCGTVPPHGAAELTHPEPGFYIVGSKAYGRAPTFLMATGYEQVRSVAAAIAGDHAAASEVHLVLPHTGVCSAAPALAGVAESGCCGGPAPAESDACCVADAEAKERGDAGCGCATTAPPKEHAQGSACCGVDA